MRPSPACPGDFKHLRRTQKGAALHVPGLGFRGLGFGVPCIHVNIQVCITYTCNHNNMREILWGFCLCRIGAGLGFNGLHFRVQGGKSASPP